MPSFALELLDFPVLGHFRVAGPSKPPAFPIRIPDRCIVMYRPGQVHLQLLAPCKRTSLRCAGVPILDSLPDAERREDRAEQIFAGEDARDFPQRLLRRAQVLRDQFLA